MEINNILAYMSEYGLFFLGLIIFLEYLNLPGFPAGVILPLAGMWSTGSINNLMLSILVSVGVALFASWILYFIGWYGGDFLITKYTNKFPSHKKHIDKSIDYLQSKGKMGVFLSKLVPVLRTTVGVPAGALKISFVDYTLYSAMGILVWNGVLILVGHVLGSSLMDFIV